jgi:hypothetical protein
MAFDTGSILYLAVAAAIIGFCFWKPNFPRWIADRLGIRSDAALRRFLLLYWLSVPVVIYRFLYLATAP